MYMHHLLRPPRSPTSTAGTATSSSFAQQHPTPSTPASALPFSQSTPSTDDHASDLAQALGAGAGSSFGLDLSPAANPFMVSPAAAAAAAAAATGLPFASWPPGGGGMGSGTPQDPLGLSGPLNWGQPQPGGGVGGGVGGGMGGMGGQDPTSAINMAALTAAAAELGLDLSQGGLEEMLAGAGLRGKCGGAMCGHDTQNFGSG